jgi:hypothetical protein
MFCWIVGNIINKKGFFLLKQKYKTDTNKKNLIYHLSKKDKFTIECLFFWFHTINKFFF